MFIWFKFLNDFNCIYSCIYSVVFIYWLIDYLLISSFLLVLLPLNQSPICKDSQLLMQILACTYKCKYTASFPSFPTQIQHSTHWGSIQAMIWKIFFNSQKKKSLCVKSTISLTKEKPLGLPWWPAVKTALPVQWASVRSLVRERRSHRPPDTARKKKDLKG